MVATMTTDRPEVSDALDLVARVETHLSAVEAAMQRVDNGEYGRCEACGTEIDAGELEADPARNQCAEHQGRAPAERQ